MSKVNTKSETNGTVDLLDKAPETVPSIKDVFKAEGDSVSLQYKLLGALASHYRYPIAGIAIVAIGLWWFWPRTVVVGNGYAFMPPAAYAAPAPMPVTFAQPQQLPAPSNAAPSYGTVSFVVSKVSRLTNGVFLNSKSDHRAPGNQAIMLTGEASKLQAEAMVGRKVTATGVSKMGKAGPFTSVNNPTALRVE